MKKVLLMTILIAVLMIISGCGNNPTQTDTTVEEKSESMAAPAGGGLGGKSADTAFVKKKYLDVKYAEISDTQKLDIYFPNEGDGPFPVIIAIHGGAFKMGNKTGGDVAPMIGAVNHGYVVVCVDYRLSGEAVFPAAISDIKAAIRFVKANSDKYGLDAENIGVWGDSAGGNLAALVGTSGDDDSLNGDNQEYLEYTSTVKAVVDWFGPLDFLKMDEQFKISGITPIFGETSSDSSPESAYVGGNITQNIELTKKTNPGNYITKDDPYFLIEHGTDDQNVPTQQSIDFAEQLTAVLGEEKVNLIILDGAAHGGEQFESDENLSKVFDFLDNILKF